MKKTKLDLPFSIYLKLGVVILFVKIMRFLTRFPPFSFFFQDRKFHYQNSHYVKIANIIEDEIRELGKYMEVYFVDYDNYFYSFYLRSDYTKRKVADHEILTRIKKRFGLSQEDIYLVTDNIRKKRILIAKESISP